MKNTLIATTLTILLLPSLASAELNYNAVHVNQATTTYRNGDKDLKELSIGISKSFSPRAYLQASFANARQATPWIYGDRIVSSVSLGAGYHSMLMEDTDAIVEAHATLGSSKWGGASESANGYDVGIGIRTVILPGLEGAVSWVQARTSNGPVASSDMFPRAQFGYSFLPQLQVTMGLDLKPDETLRLGFRYFY
ncbi:MAG: hypothetical protein HY016_08485 [Nitrosomonadales bacterium]|nr:hypothetical protein [Nitrosomonadales bacterium]